LAQAGDLSRGPLHPLGEPLAVGRPVEHGDGGDRRAQERVFLDGPHQGVGVAHAAVEADLVGHGFLPLFGLGGVSQFIGAAVATSGFSGPRPYCSPTLPRSPGRRTTVCSASTSSNGTVVRALPESAMNPMCTPWVAMSPW